MKRAAIIASALVLAGCASVTPHPYTEKDVKERVAADRREMYADQEPITKPLTFPEAVARALKYNLDYRLKLMESALAAEADPADATGALEVPSAGSTSRLPRSARSWPRPAKDAGRGLAASLSRRPRRRAWPSRR